MVLFLGGVLAAPAGAANAAAIAINADLVQEDVEGAADDQHATRSAFAAAIVARLCTG